MSRLTLHLSLGDRAFVIGWALTRRLFGPLAALVGDPWSLRWVSVYQLLSSCCKINQSKLLNWVTCVLHNVTLCFLRRPICSAAFQPWSISITKCLTELRPCEVYGKMDKTSYMSRLCLTPVECGDVSFFCSQTDLCLYVLLTHLLSSEKEIPAETPSSTITHKSSTQPVKWLLMLEHYKLQYKLNDTTSLPCS